MFKPQEPHTNGYVNEGHNYEHDRSKSPTIKISELINDGHNVIDRFTGSQDLYSVSEKINAKNEVDSSSPITVSSYMVLNINFAGEVKEQDAHYSQSDDNLETKTSTHSLEQNVDLSHKSDEPECNQHALCRSVQETISFTESVTLESERSKLTLHSPNSISNCSDLNELPESKNVVQGADAYPPNEVRHDYSSSTEDTEDTFSTMRSNEPFLISQMIERRSARGSKKDSIVANGIHTEDDLDPDVAEALAALAAAIAGEEFEGI